MFTPVYLAVASLCALAHYTFSDWVTYPGVKLWKEHAYWADSPSVICAPVLIWISWVIISLARLRPALVIAGAAAVLCLGDVLAYLVWINMIAAQDLFRMPLGRVPIDFWEWCGYWTPIMVVAVNLVLARHWWKLFAPKFRRRMRSNRSYSRAELAFKAVAFVLGSWAVTLTAIHLIVPRMAVNEFTLSMADLFLVRPEWKMDFDFVVQNPLSLGKRLGGILAHAELANLQRHQFYKELDNAIYQEFVVSPIVDRLPLSELDWRRTLWENFYPRIRNEHDPLLAAQIVVRFLREHVGIDDDYPYQVGVETIWIQQMTNGQGFDRIYVAALRSVGIAARLDESHRAELWTGNAWLNAPRPIVESWSKGLEAGTVRSGQNE
jgi:hypothetical protein